MDNGNDGANSQAGQGPAIVGNVVSAGSGDDGNAFGEGNNGANFEFVQQVNHGQDNVGATSNVVHHNNSGDPGQRLLGNGIGPLSYTVEGDPEDTWMLNGVRVSKEFIENLVTMVGVGTQSNTVDNSGNDSSQFFNNRLGIQSGQATGNWPNTGGPDRSTPFDNKTGVNDNKNLGFNGNEMGNGYNLGFNRNNPGNAAFGSNYAAFNNDNNLGTSANDVAVQMINAAVNGNYAALNNNNSLGLNVNNANNAEMYGNNDVLRGMYANNVNNAGNNGVGFAAYNGPGGKGIGFVTNKGAGNTVNNGPMGGTFGKSGFNGAGANAANNNVPIPFGLGSENQVGFEPLAMVLAGGGISQVNNKPMGQQIDSVKAMELTVQALGLANFYATQARLGRGGGVNRQGGSGGGVTGDGSGDEGTVSNVGGGQLMGEVKGNQKGEGAHVQAVGTVLEGNASQQPALGLQIYTKGLWAKGCRAPVALLEREPLGELEHRAEPAAAVELISFLIPYDKGRMEGKRVG
jgi:hypothetical protein